MLPKNITNPIIDRTDSMKMKALYGQCVSMLELNAVIENGIKFIHIFLIVGKDSVVILLITITVLVVRITAHYRRFQILLVCYVPMSIQFQIRFPT